ncbi:hypothetical protein [Bordetella trematum]|uniref:hypothetical protein n=1 Tax=Bordetella trematum TaxID=123899 RepID=UPI000ABFEBD8|nr:hypothetical protein [Bordetella trematum]
MIRRHGYDSPECVIARLHQWIGLHGGKNNVTLLMYEAHKALVQLRTPVADERAAFKKCHAAIIKAISSIARADGPDTRKEDDPELLYRSPVMDEVVRIRGALDECSAALASAPDADARDAAFEAVRLEICKLPRYSFFSESVGRGPARQRPKRKLGRVRCCASTV